MENKSWTVSRKGKFEKVVFVLAGFFVLEFIFLSVLGVWRRASWHGTWPETLILVGIATIPIVYALLIRVLKTKTPVALILNMQSQEVSLKYSKKSRTDIKFDSLAYSIINNKEYKILTIFRTYVGTRGQTVYQEETEIYGIDDSSSWTMDAVKQIEQKLVEIKIEETYPRSSKLPLWERIISN